MTGRSRWTILTYIAAHNDLDTLGRQSFWEIVNVGSTTEVRHGILYDGPQGAARYAVGNPGEVLSDEALGSFDSGDPGRLTETALWLFEQHPAERYGLVLWSHGSGWMPDEIEQVAAQARGGKALVPGEAQQRSASAGGAYVLFRPSLATMLKPDTPQQRAVLFDDGSGHSVDTVELGKVAATLRAGIGQPLDLLGMDACLMATAEVAYELRCSVRVLVASEELVPGHSWPYSRIYSALRAEPGRDAAWLGRTAVGHYVDYYRQNPPGAGDVTMVALDLAEVHRLATAADGLAGALLQDMGGQADVLWAAQHGAETEEGHGRFPSKFDFHLYDLGSLARELGALPACGPAVKAAATDLLGVLAPEKGLVLAEGHDGFWFDHIAGVSAYLMMPGRGTLSPYYAATQVAQDTRWEEMLAAYHAHYGYGPVPGLGGGPP